MQKSTFQVRQERKKKGRKEGMKGGVIYICILFSVDELDLIGMSLDAFLESRGGTARMIKSPKAQTHLSEGFPPSNNNNGSGGNVPVANRLGSSNGLMNS